MKKFKRSKAAGFFDEDIRLCKLTKAGDPPVRLAKGVGFSIFSQLPEEKFAILAKGKGSRPHFRYALLCKIMILQRFDNLPDDQMEYQICNRLRCMWFLSLTPADDVPDAKTIWHYRDNVSYYGYKNHVKCETGSKIITQYTVTHAVHNSQATELTEASDAGQPFYADSAYKTHTIEEKLNL